MALSRAANSKTKWEVVALSKQGAKPPNSFLFGSVRTSVYTQTTTNVDDLATAGRNFLKFGHV